MQPLFLTVGMGSLDEYPSFVSAGADEVFCGFVPESWQQRFSCLAPLNRREVHYANCQLGSESEMKILHRMMMRYQVPVTLTFNALNYAPDQLPMVTELMQRAIHLGFDRFILADMGLIMHLSSIRRADPAFQRLHLHISGELGPLTPPLIELLRSLGAERIIFPRKTSFEDMALLIRRDRELHPSSPLEWEMFLFNENCTFSGCFCNALHCDALPYACRLPGAVPPAIHTKADPDLPGSTGCGLCALPRAAKLGITHFKLVSRGALPENTLRDIAFCRLALNRTGQKNMTPDELKNGMFPNGCSGACYYEP